MALTYACEWGFMVEESRRAYLRYEYGIRPRGARTPLFELIEMAPISDDLRSDLHALRKYRNCSVHINDPYDDAALLARPEYRVAELESTA